MSESERMMLPPEQRCCYTGWNTFGRTHEEGCMAPKPTGTVDPKREVPEDEAKALVTIEAVERLVKRALRALDRTDGDTATDEDSIRWATLLLTQAVDVTTARTCTAVKSQNLSDEISLKADDIVAKEVKIARRVQASEQGRPVPA